MNVLSFKTSRLLPNSIAKDKTKSIRFTKAQNRQFEAYQEAQIFGPWTSSDCTGARFISWKNTCCRAQGRAVRLLFYTLEASFLRTESQIKKSNYNQYLGTNPGIKWCSLNRLTLSPIREREQAAGEIMRLNNAGDRTATLP